MKRIVIGLLLLLSALVFSGCAAIVNGVYDKVNVNSNNLNTELFLDGQPQGKGFASIQLRKGDVHTLTGKLPGCQDTNFTLGKKLDTLAVVSILTLPFDMMIGSAWEADPKSVMLNPACLAKN